MKQDTADYRTILKQEMEVRFQKNPKYSLRAFARDIGLSPSRLSHVLKGTFGLSAEAAGAIAQKLGMNSDEKNYFCDLVESAHARSQLKRSVAKSRLAQRGASYHSLTADAFRVISDWYHFAILELCKVDGFASDFRWMAGQLGISSVEAESAVKRLLRLEMLEVRKGKYCVTGSYFANPSGVPSEAIKRFHQQILEKAIKSIYLDPVEERDFSNLIFAIDSSDLPNLRDKLRAFRMQIDAEFGNRARKDRVFNLALQLFPLQVGAEKAKPVRKAKNEE